ncbi:Uncharacterised protein [Mycobacteroides abscessus subsp. abscessus]|nr:Uncharacterised protein [Mycobacteroides abscessus subsp. abscessus]
MIIPQLGAAIAVLKNQGLIKWILAAGMLFKAADDFFSNSIHTADRRDNPQFIADTGFAVFAPVALEGSLLITERAICKSRRIAIFLLAR